MIGVAFGSVPSGVDDRNRGPDRRGCEVVRGVAVKLLPSSLSNACPVCYIDFMMGKTATKDKRRRTTMVPVTTMEEIPVLSEKKQAELNASLKEAAARVRAGKGIDYDPKTFKDRLVSIYRRGKR